MNCKPQGHAASDSVGGRIQKARKDQGMTQRDLASASGYEYSLIVEFENHRAVLCLGEAVRIARALDVSLDYLAGLSAEYGKFPDQEAV